MNKREFMVWLGEVEQGVPVAEWTIGGVHVWPIVRLDLYAQNFNVAIPDASLAGGWRSAVRTVAGGTAAWAIARVRDWPRSQSPTTPADAVFLAYATGAQPAVRGRHLNYLLAPYVELLARGGRTATVWEMCPYGHYSVPRYTPSHFIQPYLMALRIRCRLRVPPLPRHLPGFEALVARARAAGLRQRYDTPSALAADTHFVRRLAHRFRRWLVRVAPTHGFIADYGLRELAFCLACREAGVVSIDIQHGVQGELHPAYGCWTALPPQGYALRPRVFWTRDEASHAAIERWACGGASGHRAILGGDAWGELWLDRDWAAARTVAAEIAAHRAALGGEAHVLVTLDSTGPLVPDELLAAMRCAPAGWRFWIRLHPVNQPARRGPVKALLRKARVHHADLDFATRLPLHPLLQALDLHVTASWSTVVLDAEAVGLRSVACQRTAIELFQPQLASGVLQVAEQADRIVAAAGRQLAAGRTAGLGAHRRSPDAMVQLLQLRERDLA
jgi:hypothetical protein